jgi:hemolysin III
MTSWEKLSLEEKFNVFTHGMGMILAIIGSVYIIPIAWRTTTSIHSTILVFCLSMIWMYSASTYYHLSLDPIAKLKWRVIDHMSIFALIGGTYTPFIAIYYGKTLGWLFLAGLWMIILLGMLLKYYRTGRNNYLSTLLYLILGWLVVVIYEPITESMAAPVYFWLVAGGFFYTLGIIFYLWKSLRFHHGIWHLFVLGGTTSHFVSILLSLPD